MGRLLLGLAVFLAGMGLLTSGLKSLVGGAQLWSSVACRSGRGSGPVPGALLGMAATVALQSSSAVTVALVGLREAGALDLPTALAATIGSNVGTCTTPEFLALGIDEVARPLMALGALFLVLGSRLAERLHLIPRGRVLGHVGKVVLGSGLLFVGMGQMEAGAVSLVERRVIQALLQWQGRSKLLYFLVGCASTSVIQSSGVMVALAMALARSNALPVSFLIPVVFGANVGTCSTAFLAAAGRSRKGLQVAIGHLLFNAFGAMVFLPFSDLLATLASSLGADPGRQLAHVHLFFNVTMALAVLPVLPLFHRLVAFLCPEGRLTRESAIDVEDDT